MRKYLIGISAAAILALAAGCGDDPSTDAGGHGEPTSAHGGEQAGEQSGGQSGGQIKHNEQDMAFVQAMIPHHQQAVDMAGMAEKHATDAKVKDLAARIKGAQDPEIQKMTDMYEQWGESMEDMPGMDHGSGHGGASGPGMMSDKEMQQLEKAKGAAFDRMWVQMMIKHHQGAVDMAQDELDKGGNADAKALAQQILDTQQAEIKEMQKMS
jgi:uncharacterized protein (DUF305 family)